MGFVHVAPLMLLLYKIKTLFELWAVSDLLPPVLNHRRIILTKHLAPNVGPQYLSLLTGFNRFPSNAYTLTTDKLQLIFKIAWHSVFSWHNILLPYTANMCCCWFLQNKVQLPLCLTVSLNAIKFSAVQVFHLNIIGLLFGIARSRRTALITQNKTSPSLPADKS